MNTKDYGTDHEPGGRVIAHYEEACLIFAARYAHERDTRAALMVVNTILNKWDSLSKNTQERLIGEAKAWAAHNHDDWRRLIEQMKKRKCLRYQKSRWSHIGLMSD